MPSTQQFGAWVTANGLDQGVAESHTVRNRAMWLAEHWADVKPLNITNHHPMGIYQECRDAGYAWAQTERKPKPDKPKPKLVGWPIAMADAYEERYGVALPEPPLIISHALRDGLPQLFKYFVWFDFDAPADFDELYDV